MKVICPNLKNKAVKSQFNELVDATSENAAYHIWSHNNGNSIDRDPNGSPSKLFSDLLRHFNGDRRLAIQAKAKVFANSFTEGNKWLETGKEPTIQDVIGVEPKPEVVPEVRNREMATLLAKIYPQIRVETVSELGGARGKALIESNEAGQVLLSAVAEKADTLPHEYAHHYVAWFRESEPVKQGTKLFGSEEAFVQAIGEQSIKALKWYNRILSWFKGLFDDKQYYLAKVTNSFLNGQELGSKLDVQPELRYQLIERRIKPETTKAIDNIYERIMTGLKARVNEISKHKVRDVKKEEELEHLYMELDSVENEQAIINFIGYMSTDMLKAAARMDDMVRKSNEALENGTEFNVSSESLMQIKHGFFGFYAPLIENLKKVLNDPESYQWLNDKELRKQLMENLEDISGQLKNFADKRELLVSRAAKKMFLDVATEYNSPTIADLSEKLDGTDDDINAFTRWTSSPLRSKDEAIRVVAAKITEVKNSVYDFTLDVGKTLTAKLEHVKLSDVQLLFERDKNGKKTGFMLRDLNYGQYLSDYNAFLTKQAEKYGLENIYSRPADKNDLKAYNTELNKWLGENAERKYKADYYELFNNLSAEAKFARDQVQLDIDTLYAKHTDAAGNVHIERFTDEEWLSIERLEKRKSNLGNLNYEDGTPKSGLDLEIAKDIKALNEELIKNVQYTTNIEKFKAEATKKRAELSDAMYNRWMKRNTVVKIRQSFYDLLATLEKTPQTPEYEALNNHRKELLKRGRREDGSFDTEGMSEEIKKEIAAIDFELERMRTFAKKTPGALKFDDIAIRVVDPEYMKQLNYARTQGDEIFQQWLETNTYLDENGVRKPASFWVKIEPKDRKKFMYVSPTSRWSEIDKASNFYNTNFDETSGEMYVPKRSKYDNSRNYNAAMNKKGVKELYDLIIKVIKQANDKLHFQVRANNYKIPQIEGGLMNTLKEVDGIFKKIHTMGRDVVNIRPDDQNYNLERAIRPDGSPIEMVPTRYMKMLEDTSLLTEDIVGAVIKYAEMADNFQKMTAIKSDLEVMAEQIGARRFKHTTGKESNSYKRIKDLLDMHVYGKSREKFTVSLFGKEFELSKFTFGISDLTRKLGISQNINVILTGLTTNIMHAGIHSFVDVYFDNTDMLKADAIMVANYHNAVMGIGKPNYKDKALALLEYHGVNSSLDEMYGDLHRNRFERTIKNKFWFGGHSMVDFATKGRMATAILLNHKQYNGEFISKRDFMRKYFTNNRKQGDLVWRSLTNTMYDAYEMVDGKLVIKDEFKSGISKDLEHKVRNVISTVSTMIDGQLSDMDKAKVHANFLTQFLVIYRNFMLQFIQNKFGSHVYSYHEREMVGGDATMILNLALNKFFNRGSIYTLREQAGLYEDQKIYAKKLMKKTITELTVAFIVLPLIVMPFFKQRSDEDKDDWSKGEASYLATRVALELQGVNNPMLLFELFKSPTAATSIFDDFGSLFNSTVGAMYDTYTGKDNRIKRGAYKGYTPFEKSLIKLTPMKFYMEAQDPRAKQRYLENQILK